MLERPTVLCVLGTRPEAVKMAPVIRELRRRADRLTVRVCVTGQHRTMLDQILRQFDIVPDVDLDLMRAAQSPSDVAAAVLTGLAPILERERPAWVLVQGDTTTAAAAAMGAFYARSRVGHVEAGLRSFDPYQPFPEEINRRMIGAVAERHFAPTPRAAANLLREGVAAEKVRVTGNTVVDALEIIGPDSDTVEDPELHALDPTRRLVLVTAHRRESFGAPLAAICDAIRTLAARHPDVQFLYPVHLNPDVIGPVRTALAGVPGVHLVRPLQYLSLLHVLRRCHLVLTDSGGIQEEAPSFGKPVLVLREVTERPEAVEAGIARIVGTDAARIVAAADELLADDAAYARMARARNPFGDGCASQRIAASLLEEAFDDWAG